MTLDDPLHRPAGSLADGPWSLSLAPETAGWVYSGLRVADLRLGQSVSLATGRDEVIVLPLSGSYEVSCAGQATVLEGRTSVFAGPTDFAYAPPGAQLTVTALVDGRVAGTWQTNRKGRRVNIKVDAFAELDPEVQGGVAGEVADIERFLGAPEG